MIELMRPVSPNTKWTVATLYSFARLEDGVNPQGGIVFDKAGTLYGTTTQGGVTPNGGTVFSGRAISSRQILSSPFPTLSKRMRKNWPPWAFSDFSASSDLKNGLPGRKATKAGRLWLV
jgi:hypothetical protein